MTPSRSIDEWPGSSEQSAPLRGGIVESTIGKCRSGVIRRLDKLLRLLFRVNARRAGMTAPYSRQITLELSLGFTVNDSQAAV